MISNTMTRIEKHRRSIEMLYSIHSYELLLEAYEKESLCFKPTSFTFIDNIEELRGEILDFKDKIKKLEDRYIVANESF